MRRFFDCGGMVRHAAVPVESRRMPATAPETRPMFRLARFIPALRLIPALRFGALVRRLPC
ncbi:hypothetical protein, partial [Burkholderia glumae]|uniref:hypothetical protein n=1 Tax=Burkholderia glumae TaxID=337 RepID=UPI0019D6B450